MGMYTEIVLAMQLKRDTPSEVIEILEYLVDTFQKQGPEIAPSHPFFQTPRWKMIGDGDSYYFPGITNSKIEYDDIARAYFLTVRSNLKNYDQEIQKFLHWLAPYSQAGTYTPPRNGFPPTGPDQDFVGYFFYEEDERPTLVFFHEGKAYFSIVKDVELRERDRVLSHFCLTSDKINLLHL